MPNQKSHEELLEKAIFGPPERPPSFDETGRRVLIAPAPVRGIFRKWRTGVYWFLIFVFLILPWTTFQGRQTVWLDLAHRKFHFGSLTLFAHDGPLIFFVLGIAAFSIIAATAIWGRVWCGWACPQTVFIDAIYRKIDELTEGNHLARRKLNERSMDFDKFLRKSIKWVLFALVSWHIAHSFAAYFVGAHNLVWITLGWPQDHWGLFLFVQIFSLILLIDFGWFREQFCLIACPYGRFQSVLMDRNSLAPLYDQSRGEPRRAKDVAKDAQGDCVSCNRCVVVCPTGIDIRNGLQMECIACTACIDACDEVMQKLNKPKGLIRYTSEAELNGKPRKIFTPRVFAYVFFVLSLVLGLTSILLSRSLLDVKIVRAIEAPYQLVGEDFVMNHFRIHVTNQSNSDLQIKEFSVDARDSTIISPQLQQTLLTGEEKWIHVFVRFPRDLITNGRAKVVWSLGYQSKEPESQMSFKKGDLPLVGP